MSLKEMKWKRGGMRMIMQSGHKTFDRQTNCISTGNTIANTEIGWFIRPSNDVECNGYPFSPGELQEADLKNFGRLRLSEGSLRKQVTTLVDKHGGGILYAFFHLNGEQLIVHGYVLTDKQGKYLWHHVFYLSHKSYEVVEECCRYVCQDYTNQMWNYPPQVH